MRERESDVTHPSGSMFVDEARERVRGEEEKDTLTGGEGEEVGLKVVIT